MFSESFKTEMFLLLDNFLCSKYGISLVQTGHLKIYRAKLEKLFSVNYLPRDRENSYS